MIDFKIIEEFLENKPPKIIKLNKLITYQEMKKLSKYGKRIKDFLKNRNPSDSRYFIYELKCNKCNTIFQKKGSKNKFLKDLCNLSYNIEDKYYKMPILCDKCKEKLETEEKEKKETTTDKYDYQEICEQYTKSFIETYLDPNRIWIKEIKKTKQYVELTKYICYLDNEKIAEYIKNMDYSDFLKTPYWVAISNKKKAQAGYRCQICGSVGGKLIVHHNNYDIYGREHEYFSMRNGLIVLCDKCHKKFHNKLEE